MVNIKKYTDNWITVENYQQYATKRLVVQDVKEDEGRYGVRLVAVIKDVDDDFTVKMTLGKIALTSLLRQGFDDTEKLIGMSVKVKQTIIRGKVVLYLEVVNNGDQGQLG